MTCSKFFRSWDMAGEGLAVWSGVWMGVVLSKCMCGSDGVGL